MKTIAEVRQYLANEQALATVMPASPEYQLFTALLRIADACETVEEFVARAARYPLKARAKKPKRQERGLVLPWIQCRGKMCHEARADILCCAGQARAR